MFAYAHNYYRSSKEHWQLLQNLKAQKNIIFTSVLILSKLQNAFTGLLRQHLAQVYYSP